jgi:DNA polymerase III sliding clamp (beta) subunit (PCNA family)
MINIQLTLEDYLDLVTVGNYATKGKDNRPLLAAIKLNILDTVEDANGMNGTIQATATDSYRLAIIQRSCFIESDGILSGSDLLLPAESLLNAAKQFKAVKKNYKARGYNSATQVTLNIEDDVLTITCEDMTVSNIHLIPGNYPKVEQLIPAKGISETELIAFNPVYLADIAKIAPFNNKDTGSGVGAIRIVSITDTNKPALFEDASGLTRVVLMPVKVGA